MAVDSLKVACSLLKEVSEGNIPNASDYGITEQQFGDIVEDLSFNYLKGAIVTHAGPFKVMNVFLESARVTMAGREYLYENSSLMKTYRGLKEIKDWI